jgi:uncharacterized membrane protein
MDDRIPQGHKARIEKEQKQVTRVYAAMVAMLIFSCISNPVLQVVAILLLFYVMFSAYSLRAGTPEDSMVRNHMTFLIRTFWISSLVFLVCAVPLGIWLWPKVDLNGLMALAQQAGNDPAALQSMGAGQIMAAAGISPGIYRLCNLILIAPCMLYFIYRVAKGLARAMKGYRLNDVKSWF